MVRGRMEPDQAVRTHPEGRDGQGRGTGAGRRQPDFCHEPPVCEVEDLICLRSALLAASPTSTSSEGVLPLEAMTRALTPNTLNGLPTPLSGGALAMSPPERTPSVPMHIYTFQRHWNRMNIPNCS